MARFHRSTARLAPERENEVEPLSAHLAGLSGEAETNHEALLAGVGVRARGNERRVALRWLEVLPEAIALAGATLRDYPAGARRVSTLCHGDLWAAHVHFDRTTFVGFADFESMSFGSPAFDLAQLILHFNGWPARDAVLDAYERASPLEREDKAVLPAAAVADLAWEGYWSLGLLYGDAPYLSSTQKEAHKANLRTLLESLELIVAEVGG